MAMAMEMWYNSLGKWEGEWHLMGLVMAPDSL